MFYVDAYTGSPCSAPTSPVSVCFCPESVWSRSDKPKTFWSTHSRQFEFAPLRGGRDTLPSISAQLSGTTAAAAEALAIWSHFWSMYRVLDLVICAGLESLQCILPRGPEYSGHSHWFPGARHVHAVFAARQDANLDLLFCVVLIDRMR